MSSENQHRPIAIDEANIRYAFLVIIKVKE